MDLFSTPIFIPFEPLIQFGIINNLPGPTDWEKGNLDLKAARGILIAGLGETYTHTLHNNPGAFKCEPDN